MASPNIENLMARTNGPRMRVGGSLYKQIADKTVVNTTTETSLIGTGSPGDSLVLGANFFEVGTSLKWRLMGYIADTGTPTIQIKVKLGTTAIYDTGAQSLPSLSGNQLIYMEGQCTCRTVGASGTIFACSEVYANTGSSSLGNLDVTVPTAAVTVDTTASQTLDITVTWGTASASNTITSNVFILGINN